MGIGKRIKEARTELNMTQEDLAKLLGVTKGAVANYENETSHPKEPIMYKMFDALHVDANYLFQDVVNIPVHKNDVTLSEFNHIKKYRDLDEHGRDMVDTVLEKEHSRCAEVRLIQMPIIEKQPDMTLQRMLLQYFAGVSAGTGEFLLDDTFSLMVSIPLTNESRKADYLVATNGDSMEPLYHNGDILIVQKVEAVNIGEVGIFILDEQAYVKQLGDGCLISLNTKYDPIPVGPDGVKCIGKVIGTVDEEDMIVEEENPAFSGNPLEDPDYIKMVEAYQEEYPGMAAEKGMSKESRDIFDTLKGIVEEDIERRKKQK